MKLEQAKRMKTLEKENARLRHVVAELALEKHCQLTGRVLWSESEENLAQKLVARLQKVQ